MEGNENNPASPSARPNNQKGWWSQQSDTVKAAWITGLFALLVAIIAIVPKMFPTSSPTTDVSIGTSQNSIGNVEGDVIIQSENKHSNGVFTKPATSDEPLNNVNTKSDKVLPKGTTPKNIIDFLNSRKDDSDREYAAQRYEGKQISNEGWEAIITEKSKPLGDKAHYIVAKSDGVLLHVVSKDNLRHLQEDDKIKIFGKVDHIDSGNKSTIYSDFINISDAKIIELGG